MEPIGKNGKTRTKSRNLLRYILLLSLLCLLAGALLGSGWRKIVPTTLKQAYHRLVAGPCQRWLMDACCRWDQDRCDQWMVAEYKHWWSLNLDDSDQTKSWLGTPLEKLPLDMWIYQEIICETKPDVLVEAGTYRGGSALFFASVFDFLKHGRVLTIDIVAYPNLPKHERITYLFGSSTSGEILQKVKDSIHSGERVMVSLDSDHTKAHVLDELRLYSNIVTVNNYLVVEDTTTVPGPKEAVEEFLKTNSNYVQDRSREKFGATMFEGGWLKRVR